MSESVEGRRIAQVLATSTGGVGTHVRGLVPTLSSAGADVRVHGPQATEDLFSFTSGGARFAPVEIANGPRPPQDLNAARRLRSATTDAELIHAHGLRAGTVAALANVGRRTPLVVSLHNAVSSSNPALARVLALIERFVARSADVVLGASTDLVERAREVGARDARFAPVGAPPLPPPSRTRAAVRADLDVADDLPLLLSVGRLHEQKAYDVLIPASVQWRGRALSVIAGDGPLQQGLQQQIDELDAPVRLLGRRTDVSDLLQAADLVLLPSRWEARSLVAQEAMRAGRPLITTTSGGMAQLVGAAARAVPVGDSDALARAVLDLLDDSAERDRLAEAGARQSEQWPSEHDTAVELISIYAELLGAPDPSRRSGRP